MRHVRFGETSAGTLSAAFALCWDHGICVQRPPRTGEGTHFAAFADELAATAPSGWYATPWSRQYE
jgi:hypothetical protein